MKTLRSIKKLVGKNERIVRFKKNAARIEKRVSELIAWKKNKQMFLFAFASFLAQLPFLYRYIILAMYIPFSAAKGDTLPRIVVFGLDVKERQKLAFSKEWLDYAVAYANTPPIVQCIFLAMVRPVLILTPAGRHKQIPALTRDFLRAKNIPVLAMGNANSFNRLIARIDVDRTVKFFPALFYKGENREGKRSTVLILHHSRKFMGDVAETIKSGDIVMLPSESENEKYLRVLLREVGVEHCLAPELKMVPENLLVCLKKSGISVSSLSQKTVRQLLLTPLTRKPPFPGAPMAVLLNMQCAAILADKLVDYHVFALKSGTFHTAVNLLCGYTLVWVGENVPKWVREAAFRNSLTLLHFCESSLSTFGWRKSYPAPLWLIQVRGRRNADTIRNMYLESIVRNYGSRLDSSQELEEASDFLRELHFLQDTLHNVTLNASGRKVRNHGKNPVIALWQSCRTGRSLEDFLRAVAGKENNGRILVFALSGYSVLAPSLPADLSHRCVIKKHLSDFDDYLDSASCVHVHGVSLGIESILRGKRTVAHVPAWYTGWGLTEDLFTQMRPRTLTREQMVLAVFLSVTYIAPYSFEQITPRTALAFWYTRQRPDLGRFHEAMLDAFSPDMRFGILDMRVSFHNEPDIDPVIEERLRTSVFGNIMADMLSFSMKMPNLTKFLSLFPVNLAIDAFFYLILQAYYLLNYEQLNYILHRSSEWFSNIIELNDNEIVKYYNVYHDSVIKNWFHDSNPPVLRLPVNAKQKSRALLYYAKILVMCFDYDNLSRLAVKEASNCSPEWYAELLFSLYNNRRSEIKDTSIEKHVEMRLKFFELYRKARIAKGMDDFSELFSNFMRESLKENRTRMRELALEISATFSSEKRGKDERDMALMVVNMLRENLEHELASLLAQSLLPDEIVKRLMDEERLVAQKDTLHGQSAKKWRVDTLKMNLRTSLKKNDCTVKFASKLARGNDISIYRHYLDCAAIVNKAPTIRYPKGIIFFGNYGTFFSAILPIVLYSLRKRGYGVWPMYSNHIPLNVPWFHPLAKFTYALPHTSGPLQLKWSLDYKNKRIEAVGVNFYGCFFEAITILVRRYEFDWKSPDIQRQFRRLLKKTDSVVAWVHKLCGTLEGMSKPPKVAVLSEFAYNLPESALRVYLAEKGRGLVHFVYYKNVANYDLVHSRSDISTLVSGLDMTLWPDCRLSFLPARSRFNPWYEQRKDSSKFLVALEQIRQNLLAGVTKTKSDSLDYLRKQKASGKRIICCIGRLLFDQAEHKPGGPAHEDISDWLRHTVEIAAADSNIVVLIRPHPHESNPTAAVRARQTLRDVLPRDLPPNVLYVNPLEMTVQSLIGIMDLAVLWLGTAAWELSALGVPCAVMSRAGYDQVPFHAIFPQSREEYARLLTTQVIPQPNEETRLRGAACLYYVKTSNQTRPYPYAFVRGSNSFRTVPWFRKNLISKFMTEGDKNIDFVVDQITEGIPIN